MRKYEAFLTNNGNIAVVVREDGKVHYNAFITPKGEWLREATGNELATIAFNNALWLSVCSINNEFFEEHLPKHAPVWEFVGRIRVKEDLSSYKPETGCNGGDYAFYTDLDVYVTTINGKAVIRGVTRYSTSAEFEYDELNASFQTNLVDCQVLNTHYQYEIGNEVFNNIKSYRTQGYDTTFLEQISQVYKLEDICNLTCEVIEKDEEGEIQEWECFPENLDDVVSKLIMAGASFAPATKNRRN